MPFNAYMYVEAEQGVLQGFTGELGKCADGKIVKDMMRVQSVNHSIRLPTHSQTGEATNHAQHSPLMVSVEVDRSAAELYRAMSQNARIKQIKLYFFRSGAGKRAAGAPNASEHNWFTITLEDARIVGMDLRKAFAMGDSSIPDLLDLSFSYYKIRWEDHDDNKDTEYKWDDRA